MKTFALLLGLGLALATSSARANTAYTDVSDLWWNAAESGWGINLIHQNEILFGTIFVYSSSGAPVWYVGPSISFQGPQGQTFVYTGAIYQTNGPWFGGAFNPSAVGNRQVGTITLRFDTITTGTMTYSVDGVSVTKAITRQSWRTNNLAGSYIGAAIGTYTNCPGASGYNEEPGTVTVAHSGSSLSLRFQGVGDCTYTGPYVQAGRMGAMNGNFSCTNGTSGQFAAYEIEGSISAFTARAQFQSGNCSWIGRVGGLRRGS